MRAFLILLFCFVLLLFITEPGQHKVNNCLLYEKGTLKCVKKKKQK